MAVLLVGLVQLLHHVRGHDPFLRKVGREEQARITRGPRVSKGPGAGGLT